MTKPEAFRTGLFVLLLLMFGVLAGFGGYYAGGRSDAIDDSRPLIRLADKLIARGDGAAGLGAGRDKLLLAVQNPKILSSTEMPGASLSPLSHGLARRLAFEPSDPRFSKIRQAGYASGLQTQLSEQQLFALWLETVDMGRGPRGWLRGFYQASQSLYGRPPAQLSDTEYLRLLALATAPQPLTIDTANAALEARVAYLRMAFQRRCRLSGATSEALAFCLTT
jgi:monofunctional biosynthetic peptidoglycan transglycosylase